MDEILALERRTTGQNCSEWHLERKLRLTASDTKLIISRVADFKTLASQILKKKDGSLDFIPAVKYGLEHEDYIRYIVQQRNPQNVVRQTGLVIHPLEQYIAASPDVLIRSAYIDLLRHNLLDSAKKLSMENTFIFQQDNDPKHTATVTKTWLLYHAPRRLQTPPQSPDLNPIENL
ncbi:SWIM-type domain-containing protein [Trichonephila clavipes]|nr:SWIM-type domain-containing protein [Trichonephila clavipes]